MKVFGNHRPLIIDAARRSRVASLWSGWDTKTYVLMPLLPSPHHRLCTLCTDVKLHWSSKYTRSSSFFSRQVKNEFISLGCLFFFLLSLDAARLFFLSDTDTQIDGVNIIPSYWSGCD